MTDRIKSMSRVLVIPDFHEEVDRFRKIMPLIEGATQIIVLGDLLDTFKTHALAETLQLILQYKDDPRFTFLWANHDCHYAFTHQYFRCSGYNRAAQEAWSSNMPKDFLRKWRIWTTVGGHLISHAGFHKNSIELCNEADHELALQRAWSGEFHPLWLAGEDVGGYAGWVGGPTWLRWPRLVQAPPDGHLQIVGHTRDATVRKVKHPLLDGYNYCLDDGLRSVMWIEDGDISVVKVVGTL